jgi:hypothetical protein
MSGQGSQDESTPNATWAVQPLDVEALGAVRRFPGLRVCQDGSGQLWLIGGKLTPAQDRVVRGLPVLGRYRLDGERRLIPQDKHVPVGRLPRGPWQPLDRWLGIKAPTAGLPVASIGKAPLRLVRLEAAQPPMGQPWDEPANALLTTAEAWARWAGSASEVRLRCLRFAAASDGRVLVLGQPTPDESGVRGLERGGIVVPCGWGWSPSVSPAIVRQALGLQKDELLWWPAQGPPERLAGEAFVQACRSAARLTAQSLAADAPQAQRPEPGQLPAEGHGP